MIPATERKIESWRNGKRPDVLRYPLYVIIEKEFKEMIKKNKGRQNCVSYKSYYEERIEELREDRDRARRGC